MAAGGGGGGGGGGRRETLGTRLLLYYRLRYGSGHCDLVWKLKVEVATPAGALS